MRVFKPQTTKPIPPRAKIDYESKMVRYRAKAKRHKGILTDKGRMRVESRTWHIEFRDHLDRKQRIIAFTDKHMSDLLAAHIEQLVSYQGQPTPAALTDYIEHLPSRIKGALEQKGLLARSEVDTSNELTKLLDQFEETLRSRGKTEAYLRNKLKACKDMFGACGFIYFRDIQPGRVETYLRDLREGSRKLSYGTSNRLQQHVEQFCNWVVERTHLHKSPLACLKKLDQEQDRRRVSRVLTEGELRSLLAATYTGPERKGMSGYERYLLYRFAAETGLRAGEIRKLRKASFDFDACIVTAKAAESKGRKTCVIPLKKELSDRLKDFMATKMPMSKAFGGRYKQLTDRTAEIIKEDLEAGGLPYQDEAGLYFDFHSLRSQAGTRIIASGANVKEAQEFMRHSDPKLTMNVYAKLQPGQMAAAVEQLPDLSLENLDVIAKTGTDHVTAKNLRSVCSQPGQLRENGTRQNYGPTQPNSEESALSAVNTIIRNGHMRENAIAKTALLGPENASQPSHNPLVVGSNPTGPIRLSLRLLSIYA